MVITNNYSDFQNKTSYDSYTYQSPQTYNNSWYVKETVTDGFVGPNPPRNKHGCFCQCWPNKEFQVQQPTMNCNNTSGSAANMVASYGVYHDVGLRPTEEEDGFVQRRSTYRGVVVNASGGTNLVPSEESSCGWCLSPQTQSPAATTGESCWMHWCRPTILLLILVLLVIVFVLVSGLLLYFNCTFHVLHAMFVAL